MNKTILAAAILAMAAFAGVMIVGDDTDAEDAAPTPVAPNKVVYQIGVYSCEYPIVDGSFTVKDIADFDLEYAGTFKSWKVAETSVTYLSGQTVSITGITTADGKYVLRADIDQKAYFYVGESKVATIDNASESTLAFPTNGADAAKIFEKQTVESGYTFKGWMSGDKLYIVERTVVTPAEGETPATYTYALKLIKSDGSREAVTDILGMTFTASIQKNYAVIWTVDGTQIAKGDVASPNTPAAPVKANYNFIGWQIGDKVVITYNAGLASGADQGYRIDGKTLVEAKFFEGIAADVELKAVFEPIQLTVIFQVGEFTSAQTVLYGAVAMKPELPAGYIAWMLGEKEFDFDTPITENITIIALEGEPATVYAVTFEIEGQTPVKLDSENYKKSIPDTAREGYAFQGWVVKGASQYVDPMTYEITGDITFVAVYKEVAPPEPEQPKFYQTPLGQCAIILAVFVVGLVFYGIFTGRINVPKFKISRVEKAEESAVEQVEEEKKP